MRTISKALTKQSAVKLTILSAFLVFNGSFLAQSNVHVQDNRVSRTFLNNKRVLDKNYQYQMLKSPAWQNFKSAHGNWYCWFNEENAKPHRAYGQPIPVSGATAADKAMNFINNKLTDFDIPVADLRLQNVHKNEKMQFINYYQEYNGLKVLYSNLTVRLSNAGDVIMWGADVFNDISLDVNPAYDAVAIETYASAGIPTPVESVIVQPDLVVLPMPDPVYLHKNIYRLVYEVNVHTTETNGVPANWYTLVDANSGEIYYRANQVYTCGVEHAHGNSCSFEDKACLPADKEDLKKKVAEAKMRAADIEITVEGTVYATTPADPSSVANLANIELTVGGNPYTLDGNGYVLTTETGTQTAVIPLEGTWCRVVNDGSSSTPSMTVSVNDGAANVLSIDGDANIIERTAYNNVNLIHDYMKTVLPSFTGMDFKLPTNVEITPHECNAFYNGSSINFYTDNVDCYSLAQVNDVVFHEYGHGINNEFYQDMFMFFQNGAMGEGYADVWGFAEFEDPLLGDGHNPTDLAAVIRRYDIDPKVYPADIVGEVHADGEIIAGAWWDTYINLGNDMPAMMNLFALCYPGGQATNGNGNEGQAFTEVLLDCLLADDTDADISNGTPNDAAIVDAFRIHGITLISNAILTHAPIESSAQTTPIDVTADLTLGLPWSDYLDDVKCVYQVNENGNWDTIPMVNTTGSTWEGQIPGQPVGTVIAYYVGAEDINGVLSAVEPIQANDADPNLPYYILVGFDLEGEEDGSDFTSTFGSWNTGVADDNATTGQWELTSPLGSYSDLNGDNMGDIGNPDAICAPDYQHTPGGSFCWVTGRASATTDGIGVNDVDGGKTTLESDPMDLSSYENPTISYWRWYTNAPAGGANPGADWWQVYISNDGGSTWTFVEDTKVSERNWRRNVFRVKDYTTKSANMMMRFVASDSIRPGQNLDGGSLIEAAVDDIKLWDETFVSVDEIDGLSGFSVYPNPANSDVNLSFFAENALENVTVEITNHLGQIVHDELIPYADKSYRKRLDVSNLASGLYSVTIKSEGQFNSLKLSIQ